MGFLSATSFFPLRATYMQALTACSSGPAKGLLQVGGDLAVLLTNDVAGNLKSFEKFVQLLESKASPVRLQAIVAKYARSLL